jgi:hypothetical protein
MNLLHYLARSRRSTRPTPKTNRGRTRAPALELLEDRTVPSPLGSLFTVNEDLFNSTAQSASAGDHRGDTVAVWNDNGNIVGCYFDRIGNRKIVDMLGNTDFTIDNSSMDSGPAVAMDYNGNFVVTWTETELNGDQRVRARLFDSTPNPLGDSFTIAAGFGVHDHEAKVGMDWNGDFVVSYTSNSDLRVSMRFSDGSLNQDFSAAGAFPGSSCHSSSIACASDGGFALAFVVDNPPFPSPFSAIINLSQFDANGVDQHDQTLTADDDLDNVSSPSVAVDDQGNPVIAYLISVTDQTGTSWVLNTRQGLRFGDVGQGTFISSGSIDLTPAVAADPYNSNYVVAYKDVNDQVWVTEVATSGMTSTSLNTAQPFSNLAVSVNNDHRFFVTDTYPLDSQQTEILGQFGQLGGLTGSPVFLSLADQVLTVTGDSPISNTITIAYNGTPGLAVTVNGTEFDLSWSDASGGIFLNGDTTPYTFNVENIVEGTPVTINTGTGNDMINVSPVHQILDENGSLTVNGQGGTDTLQMFDSAIRNDFGQIYNLQYGTLQIPDEPSMAINYSGIANVMLAVGQNISSQSTTINLKGGIATSSVSVSAPSGPDSLVVDFSAGNPIPPQGLSFDGGIGSNSLVLQGNQFPYETATATGANSGSIVLKGYYSLFNPTYTLTYSNVQSITDVGVSPGRFSLPTYLTVNTGALADAVGVIDGPVAGGFQTTRVAGKNTPFNVTFATLDFANRTYATVNTVANSATLSINNPHPEAGLFGLTANGGAGNNTLIGPDQPTTWIVNAYNSGKMGSTVGFHNFQNLVGGAGNDIFQFTPTGNLAGTVDGGGGTTNRLDYSGNGGTPVTVNLQTAAAPRIKGGNPGGFSHIQFLRGGPSPNNILTGRNTTNLWVITGPNIGQVNGFAFVGMQNLVGGTGIDTFRFTPAGSVASIRAGGNLGDWLDYSPFPVNQPVSVNLATGSATGVAGAAPGAVHGIQNVRGGAGIDNLTGNALGNILIGGSSSDMIAAGSGRSVIIGGGGGDVIAGGSGDDILISGTTTFDNNFAALASILAEWQRTDKTYSQRISDLRGGNGLNGANKLVWGSTVLDDNNADTLVGGAGLDWFFANQGPGGLVDTIRNFRTPEQIN